MAHLHYNHSTVVRGIKDYCIGSTSTSWKIPFHSVSFTNQRRRFKKNRGLVHCCSSSTSTSADQQVNLAAEKLELNGIYENKKLQFGYLVSDVNWQVRRMVETEDEMKEVANVQAEAFHEPVFLFDDLFFDFFKVIACFCLLLLFDLWKLCKNIKSISGLLLIIHHFHESYRLKCFQGFFTS